VIALNIALSTILSLRRYFDECASVMLASFSIAGKRFEHSVSRSCLAHICVDQGIFWSGFCQSTHNPGSIVAVLCVASACSFA